MAEGENYQGWAIPISVSASTNQDEGDANFLMGLDMQRQLRIRPDRVAAAHGPLGEACKDLSRTQSALG